MSFKILKENIFEDKENRKDIHNRRDLLPFLASEVHNYIRDDTDGDAFRNAVKKGHTEDAKVGGDCGCIIFGVHLDICDVVEHEETDNDQSGRCCERRDGYEDGSKEHGN